MHPRLVSRAVGVAALCLAFAGCQCRTGATDALVGELNVVWADQSGQDVLSRAADYDFGTAFVGSQVHRTLTVTNTGDGRLTLSSLDGDAGPFSVALTLGDELYPGDTRSYDMVFSPVTAGAAQAVLTLSATGTRQGDNTATLTLIGNAEGSGCELPSVIDFGDVPVGERFSLDVTVSNQASIGGSVFIGTPEGPDGASFGLSPSSPSGEVSVPGDGRVVATYQFAPTEQREYHGEVQLKGPGGCPQMTVPIVGRGVDTVLSWSPSHLDFGSVAPGVDARREVVFKNSSKVPITLTDVQTSGPDFAVDAAPGADPSRFEVTGSSVPVKMSVLCRPEALGVHTATLTFRTGLTRAPTGTITLVCRGGGPAIKVAPRPTVAFGKVAFFSGSSTYQAARKVTIQNVGTRPAPGDTSANLYLGSVVNNVPGVLPLISVTPLNTNTDTVNGELEVSPASAYDPAVGIEATAGKNFLDLIVTLRPKTQGTKEAKLTIFSNDPQEPAVELTITADAQPLPPCHVSVAPTALDFGLVTPPAYVELPVTITNLGMNAGDTCALSAIDLLAGSNPAFSVVGGPVVEKQLAPGEAYPVVVRVTPSPQTTGTQALAGALHFNVSSPTTPEMTVPLTATVGPACLTIAPASLDFGTVRRGCGTAPQTFSIYNTCSADVVITGFNMPAAAGQPLGGPDCTAATPGYRAATMRCDEFLFNSTPAVGSGLVVPAGNSMPVTFAVKYVPLDLGADSGAVAIKAIQGGQNVTYVVSLKGVGDALGLQTDSYVQDLKPKADVLIVVDDSCSMADKQAAMANNFSSFIQYATGTNTDWQIGVTTTSMTECDDVLVHTCYPGADGKLLGDANNPKVLKATTPMVQDKFKAKVKVGTNGGVEMGFEPAVLALTAPLINTDNAGFLRVDANLAVVVVTDAGDQSPQPFATYLNRLKNIKGYNRANDFTFNVIGPFMATAPSTCAYDPYANSQTYAAMVSATGGVQYEICAPDWATKLQDLGKTAFGFKTSFFLNYQPSSQSGAPPMEVRINGTVVPTSDWSYNPVTQTIDFAPNKQPGPGQTLTIVYARACF